MRECVCFWCKIHARFSWFTLSYERERKKKLFRWLLLTAIFNFGSDDEKQSFLLVLRYVCVQCFFFKLLFSIFFLLFCDKSETFEKFQTSNSQRMRWTHEHMLELVDMGFRSLDPNVTQMNVCVEETRYTKKKMRPPKESTRRWELMVQRKVNMYTVTVCKLLYFCGTNFI